MHLSWTEAQAAALLEWACNVVYIPEQPAAMYHMALRVMDKATASPSLASSVQGAVGELHEALYEVRTGDHPLHLKESRAGEGAALVIGLVLCREDGLHSHEASQYCRKISRSGVLTKLSPVTSK